MSESLCELSHVNKVYSLPNGQDLTVLDDISLAVYPEEILCLLGPSGCGKSTIMRILLGLIPRSAGEVTAHGQVLDGLNPHASIVFQGAALYPWLNVFENIEEALIALGQEPAVRKKKVEDVVELVGLK